MYIIVMRTLMFVILLLSSLAASAVVVPATSQMSSECEAYLKKVQSVTAVVNPLLRPPEFPVETFAASFQPPPSEPKKPRMLMVTKDLPKSQLPFWRIKPGLMERMERERQVLTSVTKSDATNGDAKFDMKVAGIVNAPRNFAFKTAESYPRLKEVADNFKVVQYQPTENRLYLIMTALGYQERMILEMYPASGEGRDEIQFEVVWGNFKGMKGFIGFETMGISTTEMSLIADYQSKTLPLPKILMGIALEAVTQKIAQKLRAFIESDYKQALKCGIL